MFDVTLNTKTSLEVLSNFENNFIQNEDSIIQVIQDIFPDIEDEISVFEGTINFTEQTSAYDFLVIILQWYYEVCDIDYQIVYSKYHNKYQLQTIYTHDLKCMYMIECKASEDLKHIPLAYEAFSYVITTIARKTNGDMQCVDDSSLTEMELDCAQTRLDDGNEDEEELEAIREMQLYYGKDGIISKKMQALISNLESCNIEIKSEFKSIALLNDLVKTCNEINLIEGDLGKFYDYTAEPGEEGVHLSETIMIVWDESSVLSENSTQYINESLNNQYECCIKEFLSAGEAPSKLPTMIEDLMNKTIYFLQHLEKDGRFNQYVKECDNNIIHSENDVRCLQKQ